ncbi:MFS transporter [Streptomyces sp. NPDC058092]|uniref:MFS transporter n=1 Tax=Streptomyces sp. NPDC058092 TaxID=3346336 RepID=UPI0036EF4637
MLGVSVGGVIAQEHGWRWAFGAMGILGLVLAAVYGLVVTEKRLGPASIRNSAMSGERTPIRTQLPKLFSSVSVVCAYIGSGLQMFIAMALLAWIPSFLNRYYDMPPAKAGLAAGVFALISGIGMILCGIVADRVSRKAAARKWIVAIVCALGSFVLLMAGFHLAVGPLQLVLIAAGTLVAGGTAGPAAAMVANLTPAAIAATAFATLTLANSLLGLAPGPAVTGMLADHLGLLGALQLIPLVALAGSVAFTIGKFSYENDLRRLGLLPDLAPKTPELQS